MIVHVLANPDRMVIYYPGRVADPVAVIDLPRRDGLTTVLQNAAQSLHEHGWVLGVDGWREPLDPKAPFVATAHLVRRAGARVPLGKGTPATGSESFLYS